MVHPSTWLAASPCTRNIHHPSPTRTERATSRERTSKPQTTIISSSPARPTRIALHKMRHFVRRESRAPETSSIAKATATSSVIGLARSGREQVVSPSHMGETILDLRVVCRGHWIGNPSAGVGMEGLNATPPSQPSLDHCGEAILPLGHPTLHAPPAPCRIEDAAIRHALNKPEAAAREWKPGTLERGQADRPTNHDAKVKA